ncbi:hypothetical protein GCM10027161_76190 [Microbispora hainanensis]
MLPPGLAVVVSRGKAVAATASGVGTGRRTTFEVEKAHTRDGVYGSSATRRRARPRRPAPHIPAPGAGAGLPAFGGLQGVRGREQAGSEKHRVLQQELPRE